MIVPAEERAGQGAAFLDAKQPGWANKIDVDGLDMQNYKLCVLGQLHGDYFEAIYDWNILNASGLGFRAESDEWEGVSEDDDWRALQGAWERLVEQRQGGRVR